MEVAEFQRRIASIYLDRDRARGAERTFAWLVEEVGELARALRRGEPENLRHELADVFAWLVSLASIAGVDLQSVAVERYGAGCPKCGGTPCACPP